MVWAMFSALLSWSSVASDLWMKGFNLLQVNTFTQSFSPRVLLTIFLCQEKLKLENIHRLFQCQQGEVDWQEQQLQKDRQESEHLVSQMRALQSNIESLSKEKQKLEEDCQSLERKLSQTRRWEQETLSAKVISDEKCPEL